MRRTVYVKGVCVCRRLGGEGGRSVLPFGGDEKFGLDAETGRLTPTAEKVSTDAAVCIFGDYTSGWRLESG